MKCSIGTKYYYYKIKFYYTNNGIKQFNDGDEFNL